MRMERMMMVSERGRMDGSNEAKEAGKSNEGLKRREEDVESNRGAW